MSNNPVVGLPIGGSSRGLVRSGSTVSISTRRRGDDQVRLVGEHYQLGAEIGRGGFGVVYAALDLRNGRSVAIKKVSLHDIDKDELLSIESEISLLRKLNHENIVKYHDTIKTDTWLFIVLEYMENGSLAQFMKKFGSLSETLVAMYISQVLRGLAYLHEQGVLHRDVKGANILTTKDGLVKLADFGVAIKLNETQKSNSVVGSPYWMAPEVIEMAGWSFASDIWSVGCTIIELLTTKPPYFDLSPMAALFRIVQDDHPPLPERISPALHDFIMKCFMKEPRLRSSAEELLNHPWICQIPKIKVEQSTQLVEEHVTSSDDRDAMLNTIKLYAKENKSILDDPTAVGGQQETDTVRRSSHNAPGRSSSASRKNSKEDDGEKEEKEEEENWDDEFGIEAGSSTPKSMMSLEKKTKGKSENSNQQESKELRKTQLFQLSKEEANELFEDDNFWEEENKTTKKTSSKKSQPTSMTTSTRSSGLLVASSTEGVRVKQGPCTSNSSGLVLLPVEKTAANKLAMFSENDEDFAFDEFDQDQLVQITTTTTTTYTTPTTMTMTRTTGGVSSSSKEVAVAVAMTKPTKTSVTKEGKEKEAEGFDFEEEEEEEEENTSWDGLNENLFEEELDFEYAIGKDSNQKAMTKVVELLALFDPSMDDQVILDACIQLEVIFETTPSLKRDLTSQAGIVPNIMEALEMKKLDVLYAVLKVINMIIEDNQKFQENLALVGLVPVIVRLTQLHAEKHGSIYAVSATEGGHGHEQSNMYEMTTEETDFLLEAEFYRKIRFEAAKFVGQSCKTSALTLQMFIACGGFTVLVDFLTIDSFFSFQKQKQMEVVRIALEGIFSVFNLQTIPKNDICRLFVKAGLLDKFIIVFQEIVTSIMSKPYEKKPSNKSQFPWKMDELQTICDIFLLFSQGDGIVKEHMCKLNVLQGMLSALTLSFSSSSSIDPQQQQQQQQQQVVVVEEKEEKKDKTKSTTLPSSVLLLDEEKEKTTKKEFGLAMVKILKCIRNLSMEPMTLEKLDRAGTIPTLVRLLNNNDTSEQTTNISTTNEIFLVQTKEVQNIVLQAMFYLCRINRNRQTHAAQAGLIPFLHRVILNNNPLKQFALPILCDLAYASPTARAHLWSSQSLILFLNLLQDRYWQIDALKAISIWLIHDTVKIENALLETKHLIQLINCFRFATEEPREFENLLEPLCEIITRSVRLNQAFGRTSLFVLEILKRLFFFPKAIVRKNLLKMLKSLFEAHTCPTQFVVEFQLYPILQAFKQDKHNMILVKEIASQLVQAILVATGVVVS